MSTRDEGGRQVADPPIQTGPPDPGASPDTRPAHAAPAGGRADTDPAPRRDAPVAGAIAQPVDAKHARDTEHAGVEERHSVKPAKTGAAAAFALAFGVGGLLLVLTLIFSPIGLVFGILGIILGIVGIKAARKPGITGKGVAITGLGAATWAAVLGDGETAALVPLDLAACDGQTLHVPYSGAQLATAPYHDPARRLSLAHEEILYRHYGFAPGLPPTPPPVEPVPGHPAGPRVSESPDGSLAPDGAMVRSEEQLRVGVERRPVARVRLVRYIVTENQTFTVAVSREEVRLEQVPLKAFDRPEDGASGEGAAGGLDDAEPGLLAGDLTPGVHEVVLHAEQVVITKQTVPVERVRMVRRVVTRQQHISEQVRAERIQLDQTGTDQTGLGQTGTHHSGIDHSGSDHPEPTGGRHADVNVP